MKIGNDRKNFLWGKKRIAPTKIGIISRSLDIRGVEMFYSPTKSWNF